MEAIRSGDGPRILTAPTFHMGGHATHDEAEARMISPEERFRYWGTRDPIGTYENYLIENGAALRLARERSPHQLLCTPGSVRQSV